MKTVLNNYPPPNRLLVVRAAIPPKRQSGSGQRTSSSRSATIGLRRSRELPRLTLIIDMPSPSMRDLARRLLAVEAASQTATDAHVHEAVRVCEKLRISLTRFAGADGFASLLRRALALARAEVPSLQSVTVKPDGSLEGLEAARGRCDERWSRGGGRDHRPSARAAGDFHRRTPHAAPGARRLARRIVGRITFKNRGCFMSAGQDRRTRSSEHSATAHRRAGPR